MLGGWKRDGLVGRAAGGLCDSLATFSLHSGLNLVGGPVLHRRKLWMASYRHLHDVAGNPIGRSAPMARLPPTGSLPAFVPAGPGTANLIVEKIREPKQTCDVVHVAPNMSQAPSVVLQH